MDKIKDFAERIAKIQKTDRWVFIVCDGDMGEGKSCFTSQIAREVARLNGTNFSYEENMTYLRRELKDWVDGDKDGKNQKPEYSVILADEIISMFFKRNWYDSNQIDGIELLNKCRDRHLCVIGNVPNFWDLDSAIYPLVTFRVHIFERGRAWIFSKDRNPFEVDKWHKKDNCKSFRKKGNPYGCLGYVSEVGFMDWPGTDKKQYYLIRNIKRKKTEGQREKFERYTDIKQQRDKLIRWIYRLHKDKQLLEPITFTALAEVVGCTRTFISYVIKGDR